MSEATTVKAKERPVEKPIPPPDLEVYTEAGDVVEWFPGGDQSEPAQVGIVTKVEHMGRNTVNTLHPDLRDSIPQDGCPHVRDKALKEGRDNGSGGWRHKRSTVLIRRMLLKMQLMRWEKGKLVEVPKESDAPKA